MTAKTRKILWITVGTIAGLIVLLVATALIVVQSQRFERFVRTELVDAVETATGGRVELGSIQFDLGQLRVTIRDFVLHGTEPAGEDPLLRIDQVTLVARVFSGTGGYVGISSLDIQRPRVNLIVDQNGQSNLPTPRDRTESEKTPLETVVDLAIGRFQIADGLAVFQEQKIPFSARGEDLQVRFDFNRLASQYTGRVGIHPLRIQRQTEALDLQVDLPLTIQRDRAALSSGVIRTPDSEVTLSAAVENLRAPAISWDLRGEAGVREVSRVAGLALRPSRGAPDRLLVDARGGLDPNSLQLSALKVDLGSSSITASGQFQNAQLENGSANVQANLVLQELAALLPDAPAAGGTVSLQALARTGLNGDYNVDASVRGVDLGYRTESVTVRGVQLQSTVLADRQRITADPLRVDITGGRLQVRAEVTNQSPYSVTGSVSNLEVPQLLAMLGVSNAAWGGRISGPLQARGDLKGVIVQEARADLGLVPTGQGIPLRGQLRPSYSSRTDSVDLAQSFLALPSTRLDLSGALNRRLDIRLVSRDLNDLQPVMALASPENPPALPVRLERGGMASVTASINGTLAAPSLAGALQLERFQVQDRRFDTLSGRFTAANNGAAVQDLVLRRGNLDARLSGSVALTDWKAVPSSAVALDVALRNGDLRDVLALANQSEIPARGALTVQARVSGTVGDPQGSGGIQLRQGEAYGEPLELVDAQVNVGGTRVSIPMLRVVSNQAELNARGEFDHPAGEFTVGRVQASVEANRLVLSRLAAVQKSRPGLDGVASMDIDLAGQLNPAGAAQRFELLSAEGSVGLQNMRYRNQDLGGVQVALNTQGRDVAFRLTGDFAGSSMQADGRTQLIQDYPTTARLNVQRLPIERVLDVSGQSGLDVSGLLALQGQVSGTISNPSADLEIALTRANVVNQPLDSVRGQVSYRSDRVALSDFDVRTGPSRMTVSAEFTHSPGTFRQGQMNVALETNSIPLQQIAAVQQWKPGFVGAAELQLSAEGLWNQDRPNLPVQLSRFSARVQARNLAQNRVSFGDGTISAQQRGDTVDLQIDSNLAQSMLRANAAIQMAEAYPATAQLSLGNIQYSRWMQLLGSDDLRNSAFDAVLDGTVQARGPLLRPEQMVGTAEFTRAEAYTAAKANTLRTQGRQVALRNDGPVRFSVTPSGLQVDRARWTGPSTVVEVRGSAGFKGDTPLDLKLTADADLKLLRDLDPNISSEGKLNIDAAVTGALAQPQVTGRIQLQDAAYQETSMLNGISKANGVIELNGNSANIRSLTAESGGGDITVSGNVTRSGGLYRFNLQSRLRGVRVRTPQGASVVADAQVRLTGTDKNSLVAGDVDVRVVSFNARTDIGSILTQAAPPVETPSGEDSLLAAMRLNVNIRMGSTTTFQTTFAQNLDASADLTVRGTVLQPGMLGRIIVTQGELVFFGTKYAVNEGNIAFYNPVRIQPVLNLSLNTTARGVSVDLVVTGPMTSMSLSYRSDPPLPFSEIVGLLAAGKVPTSDPVLVSRQPPTQQQSLPQMGASALLGAAVTNPVAGQLKRVFGVTQLKIDPTFTSGSELPQARLTLQQQITSDLTFTYITNVTRSDPQIVRVEWAIDEHWSAIATRQENGMVGLDLFYKKRFQ